MLQRVNPLAKIYQALGTHLCDALTRYLEMQAFLFQTCTFTFCASYMFHVFVCPTLNTSAFRFFTLRLYEVNNAFKVQFVFLCYANGLMLNGHHLVAAVENNV